MRKTLGVTRRELAASLAAAPVLAAQSATPPAPGNEVEAARAQNRVLSAQLRKTAVPTLLEPAFSFRP